MPERRVKCQPWDCREPHTGQQLGTSFGEPEGTSRCEAQASPLKQVWVPEPEVFTGPPNPQAGATDLFATVTGGWDRRDDKEFRK